MQAPTLLPPTAFDFLPAAGGRDSPVSGIPRAAHSQRHQPFLCGLHGVPVLDPLGHQLHHRSWAAQRAAEPTYSSRFTSSTPSKEEKQRKAAAARVWWGPGDVGSVPSSSLGVDTCAGPWAVVTKLVFMRLASCVRKHRLLQCLRQDGDVPIAQEQMAHLSMQAYVLWCTVWCTLFVYTTQARRLLLQTADIQRKGLVKTIRIRLFAAA